MAPYFCWQELPDFSALSSPFTPIAQGSYPFLSPRGYNFLLWSKQLYSPGTGAKKVRRSPKERQHIVFTQWHQLGIIKTLLNGRGHLDVPGHCPASVRKWLFWCHFMSTTCCFAFYILWMAWPRAAFQGDEPSGLAGQEEPEVVEGVVTPVPGHLLEPVPLVFLPATKGHGTQSLR